MNREELINYLYENNVHADIKIEDLADEITAEPKVGRWKRNKKDVAGEGFFICSCCGDDVYDTTKYCPNCGAKMEGE